MINMKDIEVHYDKISAFDMLVDIAKVAGIESIKSALDEIAAQQSVQPDKCPHGGLHTWVWFNDAHDLKTCNKCGACR